MILGQRLRFYFTFAVDAPKAVNGFNLSPLCYGEVIDWRCRLLRAAALSYEVIQISITLAMQFLIGLDSFLIRSPIGFSSSLKSFFVGQAPCFSCFFRFVCVFSFMVIRPSPRKNFCAIQRSIGAILLMNLLAIGRIACPLTGINRFSVCFTSCAFAGYLFFAMFGIVATGLQAILRIVFIRHRLSSHQESRGSHVLGHGNNCGKLLVGLQTLAMPRGV